MPGGKYNSTNNKIFGKVNTTKMVARTKRSNLVKLIKNINEKQAEQKYISMDNSIAALYHDVLNDFQIWGPSEANNIFPSIGTTDSSRIGDRIIAAGFRVRMALQIPYDRRNMHIKMWFVPFNNSQGSPTTYNEFYHNISGNSQLDPLQNKRFHNVQYLGKFSLSAKDRKPDTDATILINKWIPFDKKIYFKGDASKIPSNITEYGRIILAPYDTYNSLVTDIVVTRLESTTTLHYKDL